MPPSFLDTTQIDHFINHGYVTVRDCFSRDLARELTDHAFLRLGYDRNDPASWQKPRFHMALGRQDDFETYAPKAFAAAADLVGGADRIKRPSMIYPEAFIVNFSEGADRPWEPPSAQSPGWHKDGNWFHHFLDSPEQGLLMIFIYSDIQPRGGGTFGALDSIGVLARFLAQHPEGVDPSGFGFQALVNECHDFIEWTGNAGDIVLMHPYMLHTVSQNHSGIPRFIINPALSLAEPMNFNRANREDYSPVELAVLKGLGAERYDFHPTAPRRNIISQQAKNQQKLLEEERLALARVK
jgi:hypothetical protein